MVKNRWEILFLVSILLASNILALNHTINPNHPRILISDETLPDLRIKAATTSNYSYLKIVAEANGRMSVSDDWDGGPTMFLAFMYQMNKEGMIAAPGVDYDGNNATDYGEMAVANMLYTAARRNLPYKHAYAYDWVYELLNETEKEIIVDSLIEAQEANPANPYGGSAEGNEWTGMPTSVYQGKAMIPGFAFYGDNITVDVDSGVVAFNNSDQAAEIYAGFFEDRWIENVIPAGKMVASDDGGWGSGVHYDMGYIMNYIETYEAWRTVTGDNSVVENNNRLRYTPQYWLYLGGWQEHNDTIPGGLFTEDNWKDNTQHEGRLTYWQNYPVMVYLAYIYNEFNETEMPSLAVWIKQNIIEYNDFWTYAKWPIELFLWDNHGIEAKSPQELNLSLTKLFGGVDEYHTDPFTNITRRAGIGCIAMRSTWNESEDAIIASFVSHPWAYYGHLNDHEGTFYIGYKGDLAMINSGTYEYGSHSYEYYKYTVSSNNILIVDPTLTARNKGQYYQNTGSDTAYNVRVLPGSEFEFRGITRFETNDNFDYSETDLTRNYNINPSVVDTKRVNKTIRKFIWLKSADYQTNPGTGNYFIVFDYVDAANASWSKRWLLHSVLRPEINGNEYFNCTLCGGNVSDGFSESTDTDMTTITGWDTAPTDSVLYTKTLMPENHITRILGGQNYKFMDADYVNWPVDLDYIPSGQEEDHWGNWRFEIEPTGASIKKATTFFNVLYPTENTISMVSTELINSTTGNMIGVNIDNSWVAMFSNESIQVNSTEYNLNLIGNTRHIIFDLYPSTDYKIYDNSIFAETITSSTQGTILFNTTAIGSHSYIITQSEAFHPADANEDGLINSSEIRSYITLWRSGLATVPQTFDAINIWKT